MNETENNYTPEQSITSFQPGRKMNFQMILNIILFAGLGVCLYFILTTKTESSSNSKSEGINIAHINADTIMAEYVLFQELREDIEKDAQKMREELTLKEKNFSNQVLAYQQKVQSGNISIDEAQKTEERLARQQEELYGLNDQYTNEIAAKELDIYARVLDSLNVAIEIINQQYHYDYVFTAAGILYANPEYDISQKAIVILNERYQQNTSE